MKRYIILLLLPFTLISQNWYKRAYTDSVNFYILETNGKDNWRIRDTLESPDYLKWSRTNIATKTSGSKYVYIIDENVVYDGNAFRADTLKNGFERDDNIYWLKLVNTDWKILRHYEQVLKGITPSLDSTQITDLINKRKNWRNKMKKLPEVTE